MRSCQYRSVSLEKSGPAVPMPGDHAKGRKEYANCQKARQYLAPAVGDLRKTQDFSQRAEVGDRHI